MRVVEETEVKNVKSVQEHKNALRRGRMVQFYMETRQDKDNLDALAELDGRSTSDYLRHMIEEKLIEVGRKVRDLPAFLRHDQGQNQGQGQ